MFSDGFVLIAESTSSIGYQIVDNMGGCPLDLLFSDGYQ